jgi:hypothetical protein
MLSARRHPGGSRADTWCAGTYVTEHSVPDGGDRWRSSDGRMQRTQASHDQALAPRRPRYETPAHPLPAQHGQAKVADLERAGRVQEDVAQLYVLRAAAPCFLRVRFRALGICGSSSVQPSPASHQQDQAQGEPGSMPAPMADGRG